ncbi:Uncharacterised protein [Klebsiella pneumoniae]|nr:Uncharacterised protein [Klebsiella pneumoniae]
MHDSVESAVRYQTSYQERSLGVNNINNLR